MFENLLGALESMGIFLQYSGFAMYVEMLKDSQDYSQAVVGFFIAFVDFWTGALKFCKRNPLSNIFRATGSNYYAHFDALQTKMGKNAEAIIHCAGAIGRKQAHEAYTKAADEQVKSEAARRGMSFNQETFMLISCRVPR